MTERRFSVRMVAVGAQGFKAEMVGASREVQTALKAVEAAGGQASAGVEKAGNSAGSAVAQFERLAERAAQAAATLRAAGANTGSVLDRVNAATGVSGGLRREQADVDAYGQALDNLRARYNPVFGAIRDYRSALEDIRRAHAVGAISADEMAAAISRERQASLASIAALKGRTTEIGRMGSASNLAANRMANLSFQVQDIGVSLAGGMSPFMVLAQQGSQIAQIYGFGGGGVNGLMADLRNMIGGVAGRFPILLAAIAAGTVAIAGMRAEIEESTGVAVTFGDTARAAFEVVAGAISTRLRPVIDWLAPKFQWVWDKVVGGVKWVGNTIINSIRVSIEAIRSLVGVIPDIFAAGWAGAKEVAFAALYQIGTGVESMLNSVVEGFNTVFRTSLPMVISDGVSSLEVNRHLAAGERAAAQARASAEWGGFQSRAAEILASDPLGDLFGSIRDEAVANALERTAAAANDAGAAGGNAGQAIADGMDQAASAIGQAERAIGGLEQALNDYAREATDLGKGLGQSLVGAFQSAENAVGDFVKKGKVDVRELVSSMIADFAQLAARRFVLAPLANVLSGALGGVNIAGSVLHSGGTAGAPGPSRMVPASVFARAPSMHSGGVAGLAFDEVPAILQRGERVLSRRETAGYGAVTVNIYARDAASFRQSRAQIAADIGRAVAFGRRGS